MRRTCHEMLYTSLKFLHLGCVALTLGLFLLRGLWMLQASPRLQQRWVGILPHVVDSTLLAAAIGMLLVARMSPLDHPWLLAKITALVVYVLLGSIALKRGASRQVRLRAWLAALLVFGYIVSVAVSKSVLPGLV
ncbi:SirB2 family protein [Thiohalobacter sp. IOR34]|uniref:SirB2 family protein n=1 Tax=Thiohalobacter sp. IOR34 TaxID=3057176 RepID=UPI0025AFEDFC|nr:SirB2 family protein [Thiohalobacter sp. IOR34]WJW75457.1 SirB2 family protein [Thiohalobacter sp. IOR34]